MTPTLSFAIESARVLPRAAVPTLEFTVALDAGGASVRSLLLHTRVRILAPERDHDPATRARLDELFGHTADWGRNLRAVYWTEATSVVPPFEGSATVPVRIPCGYDFDISAAKYLHAVRNGTIPLEFQFSGSLFYREAETGLQAVRLPWAREARFDMPATLWHELMHAYYPDTAWLRIRRDVFDRFDRFRREQEPPTWEAALEALMLETAT